MKPLEGERKYATVLFADVAGSTALAERLGPEEWAEVMNGAFGFLNDAVTRYGGTVGRLMGDAVLAFFGAPHGLEDHAERAVHAGLAMQREAAAYGARVGAARGIDFHVRVGVATGLVVFTTVGDHAKAEYTAMGDAANVAARLQALAPEGAVLINGEAKRLVGERFELQPGGSVPVRGRRRPVETFRVLRARERLRGRMAVRAPLVGREAEAGVLRERLQRVRDGRGGWVAVRGEAGMGKSRLLAEVRDDVRRRPGDELRWWEGRGVSYGRSGSYHPWQPVLRAALGVGPDFSREDVRARLREAMAGEPHGTGGDVDHALLEALLAVDDEASRAELAELEPHEAASRLAGALRRLLARYAREAPVVVVLDDLHWADAASVELLLALADLALEAPLLWITLYRPERSVPAASMAARAETLLGDAFVELPLRALKREQATTMLGHLLADTPLPSAVRRRILARAEGNPFFLEEVVRVLEDTREAADGAGDAVPGERMEIPDTLLGLLAARLDRLPDVTKRVAQTASVIGRTFEARVLVDVCRDAPEPERVADVDPHLSTLTSEEVLRERRPEPQREYAFKHALSQEAAYDGLLLRRRRELHRRTLIVLERHYAERLEEQAPLLAHHALRAEAWGSAARHAARAAARSLRLFALQEALAHYEAALEALDHESDPPPDLFVDVVLDWVRASLYARRQEDLEARHRLLERVQQAEGRARAAGDRARLARVLSTYGNVLMLSGLPGQAVDVLLESSELATELGDESLMLLPFFITTERMVDDDPRTAAEQLGGVIEMARTHHDRGVEAHAVAMKALAHARLGEYPQARAAIDEALALAPRAGSGIKEADVNITAGMVHYELDDVEAGLRFGSLGRDQALAVNGFECACTGFFVSGYGRLRARLLEEARRDFLRSADLAHLPGLETWLNLARAGEALVQLEDGSDGAVEDLERARANARTMGDVYGASLAERELGLFELRRGRPERAHEWFAAALAYHRRTGMRPYLARVARFDAEALDALGRGDEAAALRAEADALDAALREALAAPPLGADVPPPERPGSGAARPPGG